VLYTLLAQALTLPLLPAHRTISHLQKECSQPFREPLQFIVIAVMSVMSATFPYTYRFLHDGGLLACSGTVIVMVSVTEETPYLSGLLATVTVMTLMTMIYGLILDRGCAATS
jgi:hypothetical protein